MKLRVNGDEQVLETGVTLSQLLEYLDLAGRPCAVEVNAVVIPRRQHGEQRLNEGDAVEIVTLVGGG